MPEDDGDLRNYYVFAIKASADLLGTILVPAVTAVLARYLYQDISNERVIFFISLAVAFILSSIVVVRKVQSYGKVYKELADSHSTSNLGGSSR
jgi:hypothetical protein